MTPQEMDKKLTQLEKAVNGNKIRLKKPVIKDLKIERKGDKWGLTEESIMLLAHRVIRED